MLSWVDRQNFPYIFRIVCRTPPDITDNLNPNLFHEKRCHQTTTPSKFYGVSVL